MLHRVIAPNVRDDDRTPTNEMFLDRTIASVAPAPQMASEPAASLEGKGNDSAAGKEEGCRNDKGAGTGVSEGDGRGRASEVPLVVVDGNGSSGEK